MRMSLKKLESKSRDLWQLMHYLESEYDTHATHKLLITDSQVTQL